MRPAIARVWRGRTRTADADAYARYLYDAGIKPLEETALAVELFREDGPEETEFVTISYWETIEAMARFAGKNPRRIHHLARDPEFLVAMPEGVQILRIVASAGRFDADR